MNKRNYQRELDAVISDAVSKPEVPTLLLHSCCAPCSSYVLEYLTQYFDITVFYYNPNIYPETGICASGGRDTAPDSRAACTAYC
jgi:hypothetical protein